MVKIKTKGQFHQHVYAQRKSAKIQSSHHCLFALLGSECAKAAHKMLVKSTPSVNFTNILQADFWFENVLHSFSVLTVWLL